MQIMGMRRLVGALSSAGLLFAAGAAVARESPPAEASQPGPAPVAPATPGRASIVTQQITEFQGDADRLIARVAAAKDRNSALRQEQAADLAAVDGWSRQINARLAAGTTRGNPDLVAQWQYAQSSLDALDRSVANLAPLSADVAQIAALAGYLANAIKAAYALQGATDADHTLLIALEKSVSASGKDIGKLAGIVNREVEDQTLALDGTHRRLVSLRHAIDLGLPLEGNLATIQRGGKSRGGEE